MIKCHIHKKGNKSGPKRNSCSQPDPLSSCQFLYQITITNWSHRNQPGELRKPHKKHVSINNVQDCSPNDQGSCHSKMFGNHWLRLQWQSRGNSSFVMSTVKFFSCFMEKLIRILSTLQISKLRGRFIEWNMTFEVCSQSIQAEVLLTRFKWNRRFYTALTS